MKTIRDLIGILFVVAFLAWMFVGAGVLVDWVGTLSPEVDAHWLVANEITLFFVGTLLGALGIGIQEWLNETDDDADQRTDEDD